MDMDGILIFIGGVVVGLFVEHYLYKKDVPYNDCSGEIQAIINKLDGIIEDIKKTI